MFQHTTAITEVMLFIMTVRFEEFLSIQVYLYLFCSAKMLTAQLSKHRKESLDFGELDLTLRSIRIINKVPQSIKFVLELYLDGNHLLSLSGI